MNIIDLLNDIVANPFLKNKSNSHVQNEHFQSNTFLRDLILKELSDNPVNSTYFACETRVVTIR